MADFASLVWAAEGDVHQRSLPSSVGKSAYRSCRDTVDVPLITILAGTVDSDILTAVVSLAVDRSVYSEL